MMRVVRTMAAALAITVASAGLAQAYTQFAKDYAAGEAAFKAQDFDTAITSFSAVIDNPAKSADPWRFNAHFWRGEAHRAKKAFDKALADYRKAAELDPKQPAPHQQIGLVLYGQKKYAEAIKAYDAAIGLKGDDAEMYYFRGLSRSLLNQNAAALEDAQKANALRANWVNGLLLLGRANEDLGRKAEAIAAYESVLKLDAGNKQAREGIDFLKSGG